MVPIKSLPLLPLGNLGRGGGGGGGCWRTSVLQDGFVGLENMLCDFRGPALQRELREGRRGERLNATSPCLPTRFYKAAVLINWSKWNPGGGRKKGHAKRLRRRTVKPSCPERRKASAAVGRRSLLPMSYSRPPPFSRRKFSLYASCHTHQLMPSHVVLSHRKLKAQMPTPQTWNWFSDSRDLPPGRCRLHVLPQCKEPNEAGEGVGGGRDPRLPREAYKPAQVCSGNAARVSQMRRAT